MPSRGSCHPCANKAKIISTIVDGNQAIRKDELANKAKIISTIVDTFYFPRLKNIANKAKIISTIVDENVGYSIPWGQ